MSFRHIYRYTTSALILILLSTTAKTNAANQPFENVIDFLKIREYAEFSNASYKTEKSIREYSSSKNYALSHYNNIPDIHVSYYLVTSDATKTQNIVIRGTSNIDNAIVDIALKLEKDKRAGIQLHNGFSVAANAIYAKIKPLLKTDYIINTTGHSMGGAIAVIIAMYMDVDNFNIGQVVTFGQPKITNIAGANKFQHLNILRIVTPKDLVPLVPPLDPLDINNIDIYWHLGQEVVLLADNTYAVLEGINSMLRATKFTQETLSENNIQNHLMSQYLDMVNKKIPEARLVTFKNSFNLFNIFGNSKQ